MNETGQPVVLMVDDEPRILSALVRALRREGYELLTAESPQEALRMAGDEHGSEPTVALVDYPPAASRT